MHYIFLKVNKVYVINHTYLEWCRRHPLSLTFFQHHSRESAKLKTASLFQLSFIFLYGGLGVGGLMQLSTTVLLAGWITSCKIINILACPAQQSHYPSLEIRIKNWLPLCCLVHILVRSFLTLLLCYNSGWSQCEHSPACSTPHLFIQCLPILELQRRYAKGMLFFSNVVK